jgi:hypothetical protein
MFKTPRSVGLSAKQLKVSHKPLQKDITLNFFYQIQMVIMGSKKTLWGSLFLKYLI